MNDKDNIECSTRIILYNLAYKIIIIIKRTDMTIVQQRGLRKMY